MVRQAQHERDESEEILRASLRLRQGLLSRSLIEAFAECRAAGLSPADADCAVMHAFVLMAVPVLVRALPVQASREETIQLLSEELRDECDGFAAHLARQGASVQ